MCRQTIDQRRALHNMPWWFRLTRPLERIRPLALLLISIVIGFILGYFL
jgi:hypothetical protein